MPRVPLYEQQEELHALPDVRVRAARPGDAARSVGAGLQNAGASLGAIAARQQEQRNADMLFRAEASLKDEYVTFESSLRDRRGQNAWGVTKDVEAWFEEAKGRYYTELENDAQQALFEKTFVALRRQGMDSASRFESQERRVSIEESAEAAIVNSINVAASAYDDPEALAVERDSILRRIHVQAGFNGWSPERIEAEQAETLTSMHAQVLQAMVDADPEAAREYFEVNRDEIAGSAQDQLEKMVNTGTLRATAQAATDAIMAEGLTVTEALKKARENYNGEERDEVVTRLKNRYAENAAATAKREKQVADQAWDSFARGGNQVSAIPTPVFESLDGKTLIALRKLEAGGPVKTDWGLYYDLRQQAAADPATFASRDLRQDFPSLNEPERRQLIALQEKVSDPSALPEAASTEKQIEVALNLLRVKAKDKDGKGRFQSAVYSDIAAFTQQAGRAPTYDERQKIVDRMMMRGEGTWWSLEKPRFFEVAGTEDAVDFIPDIPDAERQEIIEALERANFPVSEEAILELYRNAHGLPSILGVTQAGGDVDDLPAQPDGGGLVTAPLVIADMFTDAGLYDKLLDEK